MKIDWVKKSNYEEIWIGLFIIDVYKDNTNEQREFIILQKWKNSKGYNIYDMTSSKYRGKFLRNLLNESDNVTGYFTTEESDDVLKRGVMIMKGGEKMIIKKGHDGSYSFQYGLYIRSLGIKGIDSLPVDQRICIINPDEQERTSAQ